MVNRVFFCGMLAGDGCGVRRFSLCVFFVLSVDATSVVLLISFAFFHRYPEI